MAVVMSAIIVFCVLVALSGDTYYELDGAMVPRGTPGAQQRLQGGYAVKGECAVYVQVPCIVVHAATTVQ
jgi:hypothetical protein